MKTKNIVLLSIVALIAIVAIYFLSKRAQNNKANVTVFQAIPDEADGVAVLNVEAFMTLFFTNLGDVWEMKDEFENGGQTEKIGDEMKLSGINLSRKIVLFSVNDQFNLLVPISDKEAFKTYLLNIDNQTPLKSIGDDQYYSSQLGGIVSFNDEICYLTQCTSREIDQAKERWGQVLNSSKSTEGLSAEYESLANSSEHFSFFMKEDEMASKSPYFEHSPATSSSLTFEDGIIRIKSTISTDNPNVQNPLKTGGQGLNSSEYINMHLNLNTETDLNYWLSEEGKREFVNMKAELGLSEEFLNNWGGVMNFSVTGTEKVMEEVVSYDFDDNFNKIEKTELKEVSKIGYAMSYDGEKAPLNLAGIEALGFGSPTATESNGINYVTSSGTIPETTSQNNSGFSLMINPKGLVKLALERGEFMAMMAQQYTDLFKELNITSTPVGQTIESEMILTMTDSDKNALLSIISALQRR